jgi:3-methyladenine DNA glycosylase/8-oxoguanine DNA glycosylase
LTRARIPLPPDFSFDGAVRSHGWYDLPPFDYDKDGGILRTFVGAEEAAVPVSFRIREGKLLADAERLEKRTLTAIARRVFSLDADLDGFARAVAGEAALARGLAQGRGRMLRAPTVFEDAVKMLLTTNCSWAATKGMVVRLIAETGAEGRAFPSPESVAAMSPSKLRAKIRCGYRAVSLVRFARRVARGQLALSPWERPASSAEEIRGAILAEHGFGPYAAEGLLRILGRHDFLAIDSWVRQEYRRRYRGPAHTTDRAIARRYARYGAHRGLALWLDMTSHWHETPNSELESTSR